MLKDKIATFVGKVQVIDGVAACALVSRYGIIAGRSFDRNLNESHGSERSWQQYMHPRNRWGHHPDEVHGIGNNKGISCSIVVMGAGEHFLIATIMKDNVDPETIYRHLLFVSKEIVQVL